MARVLEPDELLARRLQRLEVLDADLRRDPMVVATEEEEHGHLQRRREFEQVQLRGLLPQCVQGEVEAALVPREVDDR